MCGLRPYANSPSRRPDNGLLAPELAAGIARIKGVRSKGVRVGNWLSIGQAQALLNTRDVTTKNTHENDSSKILIQTLIFQNKRRGWPKPPRRTGVECPCFQAVTSKTGKMDKIYKI